MSQTQVVSANKSIYMLDLDIPVGDSSCSFSKELGPTHFTLTLVQFIFYFFEPNTNVVSHLTSLLSAKINFIYYY